MADAEPFVDFYEVLRVNPNCDARTLEAAYHVLAKKYHPDHAEQADVGKLTEVIDAYKALKNPDKRSEYNAVYASTTGFVFSSESEGFGEEESALSDADAHARVLLFLYKRRRENSREAGVGRYFVREILNCSEETFEFHLWYLREKGFIETTEQGTLAITIEGVDHVITMSKTTAREKLLLSQLSENRDFD